MNSGWCFACAKRKNTRYVIPNTNLHMSKKNAIIIHGYGGDPSGNWFPWLERELVAEGWNVKVPDFGQHEVPNYEHWNSVFLEVVAGLDPKETVLVGHSLGGALIPRVLADWTGGSFKASFLVAAPYENIGWETLDPFFDASRVGTSEKMGKVSLFYSDDDPYVPLWHSEKYKEVLGGELTVQHAKEHLWDREYEILRDAILQTG